MFDGISFLLKAASTNQDLIHSFLAFTKNQLSTNNHCFGLKNKIRHALDTSQLLKTLKNLTHFEGITGNFSFDENGLRSNLLLHVYKIGFGTNLKKIGSYTSLNGLVLNDQTDGSAQKGEAVNPTRKLVVVSILDEPFFMYRQPISESSNSTGNGMFMGYCVDLTQKLSEMLNFTYELRVVKDGKYGAKSKGSYGGLLITRKVVGEFRRKGNFNSFGVLKLF